MFAVESTDVSNSPVTVLHMKSEQQSHCAIENIHVSDLVRRVIHLPGCFRFFPGYELINDTTTYSNVVVLPMPAGNTSSPSETRCLPVSTPRPTLETFCQGDIKRLVGIGARNMCLTVKTWF
jgi:hypothetical protein